MAKAPMKTVQPVGSHRDMSGDEMRPSTDPALLPPGARKFRCSCPDGFAAIVEHIEGKSYKVQPLPLHKGDIERAPQIIDLARAALLPSLGPDRTTLPPLDKNGDGTPRPEPLQAFMLACGIRGSAMPLGCTAILE